MLTEDCLKRTDNLPKEHYEPMRLLHLAHIANDQMLVELTARKSEWNQLVQKVDEKNEIGIFTIRSPWFHPDDCFEYLITNVHYSPKDKEEQIFITQLIYCTRLFGSRVLESHFKTCRDYEALLTWLESPDSGFERYQSLEKLLGKMKEWLV